MLAFLIGLLFIPHDTSVLTVHAQVPDPKSEWIESLIQCESQGSTTVKILDSDGYYSYGLGQFHLQTWLAFGKEFGTTKENIYDGDLQRIVIRDMLDKGMWKQWYNCGKKLNAEIGIYPT